MGFLIKPLRYFFAFAVPLLLMVAAIWKYHQPELLWLEMAFAILLASMVGFYTNFIAIKMLFRPSYPTVFGRQGLIPKKQVELAERLGDGINEHFFNAQEIRQHLDQNQLLQKGSERLKIFLDDSLKDPKIQKKLRLGLSQQIENHTDDIHQFLVNIADKNLPKLIAENTDLTEVAQALSNYLEGQIDSGDINLEEVVDKFTEIAAENIPALASWLHAQFEEHNDSQGVFKRNFVSFLKWSNDIDEDSLRDQLFHLISTIEFRQAVYEFTERMALSLGDYFQTEQGMVQLNTLSEQLNSYLVDKAQEEGVPYLIRWLQNWLEQPEAWQTLEHYLSKVIDWLTSELDRYIHSERFNQDMEHGLNRLLVHFNIQTLISQKVAQLNTQNLERLVLSATREHLTAIEVLGGVLGAFAGIALFSIPTFLALLGVALLLLGIEWLLGRHEISK